LVREESNESGPDNVGEGLGPFQTCLDGGLDKRDCCYGCNPVPSCTNM